MNQKHSKEYKSIGQTIKKYRKLRGLTQEQLADMVCISISYLTKIEVNITLRQSRLSGVARATFPDKQSHLVINYCIMF